MLSSSFVLLWVWKTEVGDHQSSFIVSCGPRVVGRDGNLLVPLVVGAQLVGWVS
jgi:hypothetical protein